MRYKDYANERCTDARRTLTIVTSDAFYLAKKLDEFDSTKVMEMIRNLNYEHLKEYCEDLLCLCKDYNMIRTKTLRIIAQRRKIFNYQVMGKVDIILALEDQDAENTHEDGRVGEESSGT